MTHVMRDMCVQTSFRVFTNKFLSCEIKLDTLHLHTSIFINVQLYTPVYTRTTCTHIFTFMCTPDHAPHLTFILQTKIHLVWIK